MTKLIVAFHNSAKSPEKLSRYMPRRHRGLAEIPILDADPGGSGWSAPRLGRFTPEKESRYAL